MLQPWYDHEIRTTVNLTRKLISGTEDPPCSPRPAATIKPERLGGLLSFYHREAA
jgi:hypothetical protein